MSHYKYVEGRESEAFYGNFIFSLNFILLLFFIFIFTWQGIDILQDPNPRAWAALGDLAAMAVFTFVLGGQLCYFTLDDVNLEIRNHLFPRFRRKYRLETIDSLTISRSMGRLSRSIRVRSSESRPWSYFAGSLRDADWDDFDKALRKKGIKVENKLLPATYR